eukprot:TRINITY_DN48966_c0_g1_i1.p1 TRINITY_DN48966_c0_g1~~TRINITY_DN48966_c0_g1_i1.p1  ORF type:complete len:199 (-),score=22.61 TRINITY_DN48966_c0_g1_i1:426-959(-)
MIPDEMLESIVDGDHASISGVLTILHASLAHRSRPPTSSQKGATVGEWPPGYRKLNAHGCVASRFDADIRGEDGFGFVQKERFDSNVRCYASLGGCEQRRLPCQVSPKPCEEKLVGPGALQLVRVASTGGIQQSLAASSRKAWRSTMHSERAFSQPSLRGDGARYPWIGGNPWYVKR